MLTPEQVLGNVLKVVEVKGPHIGVTAEQGHGVATEWVLKLGESYADVSKRVSKGAPVWTDFDRNDLAALERALGFNNTRILKALEPAAAKVWQEFAACADDIRVEKRDESPAEPPGSVRARAWQQIEAGGAEVRKRRPELSEAVARSQFLSSDRGRALYEVYSAPGSGLSVEEFKKVHPVTLDGGAAQVGVLIRKYLP